MAQEKLLSTWQQREVKDLSLLPDLKEILGSLLRHNADIQALTHASKTAFDLAPSGSKSRQLLQQRRAEAEKQAGLAAKLLLRQSEKRSNSKPKASRPPPPQTAQSPVKSKLEEAVEVLCQTWTALDLPLESVANVGLSELSMSQVCNVSH